MESDSDGDVEPYHNNKKKIIIKRHSYVYNIRGCVFLCLYKDRKG